MVALGPMLSSLALVVSLPRDMSEQEREELLLGCSNALAPEKCTEQAPGQTAQAQVEARGPDRMTLVVEASSTTKNDLNEGGDETIERDLSFDPSDEPLDRARALGLSLGLLARGARPRATDGTESTDSNERPRAPDSSEFPVQEGENQLSARRDAPESSGRSGGKGTDASGRSSPRAPMPHRPLIVGLEAGASVDPRLPSVEGGGMFQLEGFPAGYLGFVLDLELRAGRSTDGSLSVRRFTPGAGIALTAQLRTFELIAQVEAGAESLRARSAAEGLAQSRWSGFLRAAVSLRFPARTNLQLSITPRLKYVLSTTEIFLQPSLTERTAPLVPSLDMGLRWSPWLR